MTHEDDYGMNGDSNLSHNVRASDKEDSQKTTTLTDNKKRDYENEGSSMHDGSCIGINNAHRFPKCFRSLHILLGFSLCTFVSSIQFVAVPIYSISDLYANSLYSFTLRKQSCQVLSLSRTQGNCSTWLHGELRFRTLALTRWARSLSSARFV